jgi:GT2 family glycosyltransferase
LDYPVELPEKRSVVRDHPARGKEMAKATNRIAIVMITHNRCDEVLASLDHLTRLPERPRIVVVDNASVDGTTAAVARRYPQVEVLPAGGNLGAAARNIGVRHVNAPYVALCDDDTWWEPGSLAHAADLFDKYPRLAVAVARILVGSEAQEDPVCRVLQRSPLPRQPNMPGPPLLGFLAGASVVRRSAFLDAGGFEPRFFIGSEEEMLAADLVAAGWWLCYLPCLVVHHHPSPRRDDNLRRWLLVRNTLWSAWLRRPLSSALRKTGRIVRTAPRGSATWRGLAAALAGLPWVLRHRRVLPPHVEQWFRLLEHCSLPEREENKECSTIEISKATPCRAASSALPTTMALARIRASWAAIFSQSRLPPPSS